MFQSEERLFRIRGMKPFLVLSCLLFSISTCFAQGVLPSATPSPQRMIVNQQDEARILQTLKERIQREERELDSKEKSSRRELVKSQNDRRREWRENERKARRAYFEAHGSGPERRAYVQGFVKRKKEFDNHEKVEWTEFKHQQKEVRENFGREHRALMDRVKQSLSNHLVPEGF